MSKKRKYRKAKKVIDIYTTNLSKGLAKAGKKNKVEPIEIKF